MPKIILASNSPRRKELLKRIGLSFEVVIPMVNEDSKETNPEKLVKELATKKGMAVLKNAPLDSMVIAADTTVYHDGVILGKPKDKSEAFRMLKNLQNSCHSVYTGVFIAKKDKEIQSACFSEKTDVNFRSLSDRQIDAYIDTQEPFDKAGAYGIQEIGTLFATGITGDYNNVVGLPLCRLLKELELFDDYFVNWSNFI